MKKLLKKWINRLRGEVDLNNLKQIGLSVGKNFNMMANCRIDYSHCWHITIGDNVTFAPKVVVLAHDASTHMHLGYTKVANVRIGNNVFIGAGTIVLPGVEIGDGCIIGAGSVVSRSIPARCLAVGNPARPVMSTADYLEKQKQRMNSENCFDESYTLKHRLSAEKKRHLIDIAARDGIAFVK